MLKKEKLRNEFCYEQIRREIHKSCGPEIKIDLPVKKYVTFSRKTYTNGFPFNG